jgi:1,4-dihydroxy-2-naphthoate octaprenyltransferase
MARKETDDNETPWARLGWSRPPFYSLGLLTPFFLGTFLAWRLDRTFNLPVFALALGGILLLIFAADQAAHRLRGGAGNHPEHPLPGSGKRGLKALLAAPLHAGIFALTLAVMIGLVLQFGLDTGPYTFVLGLPGALPVLSYLTRPIRLAERGYGELTLAACYGWFPAALAFYLQRGYIHPFIHWMALPIGLSIFNVILVSEFRRAPTLAAVDGYNLLARLGPDKTKTLFALTSILTWLALYASFAAGIPKKVLYLYLPVLALSTFLSLAMVRKRYENPLLLELIRGLTIAVSLGTMVTYLLVFL